MDTEAVQRTVNDVIDALHATDRRDGFIARQPNLDGACELVSVSIAAVLEDRGLGTWTFVRAQQPRNRDIHAWLEWIDHSGHVTFSIDATLQQFGRHGAFIGRGRTPAAEEFTVVDYCGPIEQWEWFDRGSIPFTRTIAAVREQLSLRGQ